MHNPPERALRRFLILVAMAILPSLAQAQPTKLTLTGSSTLAPVIGELAKRFRVLNPGIDIVVEGGG